MTEKTLNPQISIILPTYNESQNILNKYPKNIRALEGLEKIRQSSSPSETNFNQCVKKLIIPDDVAKIKQTLQDLSNEKEIDCIITTGGTGLTGRDTTPEAVMEIADKTIEGFGELFRQISFSKIGTSAIQSRALAALINTTYVFCLPGSKGACKDGWDEILQYQLDARHRPCNFVEIMPRLSEK